ncbi:hypothetical protein BJF85_15855 [Saccharomonospora sp. CUA-673]|uniref:DUF4333 domain-containing protein n=1 Tax=Saccharomonospora sp. CUA-673 TaxID=1904969 RepID=UPI000969B44F|nr:DUF4333 domain-containing protein [Saccharomonospora sp. CUA-673]OLT46749.1 hypothetical protein BJF85_15855 [Saccharomonospora sp. CUA-673]
MSTPYGGNDPQQWGQQPPQGTPSGSFPRQPGYGPPPQQPGQPPQQQPPQQPGGQPGYPQPGYGPSPGYPQQPPPGQPQPGQPGQQQPPQQPGQPGYTQPGMPPQGTYPGTGTYTQPGTPPGGYPPGQGQFGPPPGMGAAPPQPPKKKSGKGLWFGLGGAAIVIAVLAVVLFWVPGLLVQKVFDAEAMNRDVERVLTENYGVEGIESVSCPEDQPVTVDETFTCTVAVGGEEQQVTITVQSEDARYQVGRLE